VHKVRLTLDVSFLMLIFRVLKQRPCVVGSPVPLAGHTGSGGHFQGALKAPSVLVAPHFAP